MNETVEPNAQPKNSGTTPQIIKLKNGSEESISLVTIVTIALGKLLKDAPISFYELVMVCRDQKHKIWSNVNTNDLLKLSLLQRDGTVHSSIKNIVLSAVYGDGLNMKLGNPVKRQE